MHNWKIYQSGPANPKKIVLMLHGVGSNGQDLISLAPYLSGSLPNVLFLSPDAPHPYDMAPFGFQWFSLQDYSPDAMTRGIRETMPLLNDLIDSVLAKYSLSDADLGLLGFSQGTMMSLYTAPRRAKPVAGVLGYSGALLGGEELAGAGMHKIPVCLVHGDEDTVIPVSRHHLAMQALEKAGFPVEGKTIPGLPHSIDETGIETGARFLKTVFKV